MCLATTATRATCNRSALSTIARRPHMRATPPRSPAHGHRSHIRDSSRTARSTEHALIPDRCRRDPRPELPSGQRADRPDYALKLRLTTTAPMPEARTVTPHRRRGALLYLVSEALVYSAEIAAVQYAGLWPRAPWTRTGRPLPTPAPSPSSPRARAQTGCPGRGSP
jgi:hypothetical protein